jgi:manganese/zinc/iron transport system substrate-binding protein
MLLGALALGASALGANNAKPSYTCVATTGMVADIVRNVAGENAEIVGLLGEGVDPHLYKLTRSDMAKLMRADVVFYSGLLLEGKMSDAFIRIAGSGKPVIAVTEEIDDEYLLEPPEFLGHYDPHVWMDPTSWSKTAGVVADKLATRIDPDHASEYRENLAQYQSQLDDLDAYTERVINTIPADRRVLITAHDAFNYFGRRYGLEVLGIQGISTESEAGVREIERLVDILVDRQIPAVFVETTVPQRSVKALIAGARARGHEVVIGGNLFSDAMGAPGTYEGTYVGMIDHNATTIARALGGQAPERGMTGQLGQGDAHRKGD